MDRLKLLEESLTEYRHDLEAGPASALQASSIYLINVMFETIDDMLAVARAAKVLRAKMGNAVYHSFTFGEYQCIDCGARQSEKDYQEGAFPHTETCPFAALEAALAALEGDKQGEGEE